MYVYINRVFKFYKIIISWGLTQTLVLVKKLCNEDQKKDKNDELQIIRGKSVRKQSIKE